jgi:plastocyanin
MSERCLFLRNIALACGLLCSSAGWAAEVEVQMHDLHGQPLADAVVTLQGPLGLAASPAPAVMDQVDKQFLPRVLAVRSGTRVNFPNRDDIRHQVYSFSSAKRFELRLYKGTPSEPVLFDKPGLVVLGCNIHDWMLGYIYVTDDPWFAVSAANGQLNFKQLPLGHYRVTVWHPQLADGLAQASADIQVPAAGLQLKLPLAVTAAPAPASVTPAAPTDFADAFKKAANEDQP